MKTLIIGGDAAGMSVASKLRRADPAAQVTVFERTLETSYGACGLPYYIGGVNNDADKIRIRKPDAFRASGIDLRLLHEVVHVDYFLPGCPPSAEAIWSFLNDLLAGRTPQFGPGLIQYD